jgi:hypothetical protein
MADGEVVQNFPADPVGRGENPPAVLDVGAEIALGAALDELFYRQDGHPTRLGHRKIADHLAGFIKGRMWGNKPDQVGVEQAIG